MVRKPRLTLSNGRESLLLKSVGRRGDIRSPELLTLRGAVSNRRGRFAEPAPSFYLLRKGNSPEQAHRPARASAGIKSGPSARSEVPQHQDQAFYSLITRQRVVVPFEKSGVARRIKLRLWRANAMQHNAVLGHDGPCTVHGRPTDPSTTRKEPDACRRPALSIIPASNLSRGQAVMVEALNRLVEVVEVTEDGSR